MCAWRADCWTNATIWMENENRYWDTKQRLLLPTSKCLRIPKLGVDCGGPGQPCCPTVGEIITDKPDLVSQVCQVGTRMVTAPRLQHVRGCSGDAFLLHPSIRLASRRAHSATTTSPRAKLPHVLPTLPAAVRHVASPPRSPSYEIGHRLAQGRRLPPATHTQLKPGLNLLPPPDCRPPWPAVLPGYSLRWPQLL